MIEEQDECGGYICPPGTDLLLNASEVYGAITFSSDYQFIIPLRARPRWKRLIMWPRFFLAHYRVARRFGSTVRNSIGIAWSLSKVGMRQGRYK